MRIAGWIGANLLAFCALPQALQSLQTKSSEGISGLFLLMWGLGEILCAYYVVKSRATWDWPLLWNYGINLTFIMIIGYYKL